MGERSFKLHGKTRFCGLGVSIENRAGSVRSGVDSDGHPWRTKMDGVHYGRMTGIKRVTGDGEGLDVFLKAGPHENTQKVFVVHLMCAEHPDVWDEDKVYLNFASAKEVKDCFDRHYDKAGQKLYGGMTELDMEGFKRKVAQRGFGLIKSLSQRTELRFVMLLESPTGRSASTLTDFTPLCGIPFGELLDRIERGECMRKSLAEILSECCGSEGGFQGRCTVIDWLHPSKVGARLYERSHKAGFSHIESRLAVESVLPAYETAFNEIVKEEEMVKSQSKGKVSESGEKEKAKGSKVTTSGEKAGKEPDAKAMTAKEPKVGHRTRTGNWKKWMALAGSKGFGETYFVLDDVMPHDPKELLAYAHAAEELGHKKVAAAAMKKYAARKGEVAKDAANASLRKEAERIAGSRNEHLDLLHGNAE